MAFTSFDGVSDAARAVQDYLMDHGPDVPEELRTKLRSLVGPTTSPVDTVVRGSELIYARKDDLPDGLLELGAGLALVAQQYNFHGMAEDNRGNKLALAFLRDAKVSAPTGITYPKKDDDPEVKDEFKVEAPAPEQAAAPNEPQPRVTDVTDPAAASHPTDAPRRRRTKRAAS
jgi:hypothetical protein